MIHMSVFQIAYMTLNVFILTRNLVMTSNPHHWAGNETVNYYAAPAK